MKSKNSFSDLLLLLLIVTNAFSLFSQVNEQQLKVIFIERFTQFIDWDTTQISNPDKNVFIIGTIGKNELYPEFQSFFSNRLIKGKKAKVIIAKTEEDYLRCDLLFISKVSDDKLSDVLDVVYDKPILTISDEQELTDSGILITICRKGEHLGFCINEKALARSGLNANYLLMESAEIINPIKKIGP
ncbi:MAG: YfiR family protein [Candidatus Stygibacter frigidus]|nr:YfiR family protein [Candidatus Stygibacter frigidus]